MKCFFGISNFLEEISSFSHSIVFLCFFALITEEGYFIFFLSNLAFISNTAFRWEYLSFFSLSSTSLLSQLFLMPPQTTVLPFCISFSYRWFWSDVCREGLMGWHVEMEFSLLLSVISNQMSDGSKCSIVFLFDISCWVWIRMSFERKYMSPSKRIYLKERIIFLQAFGQM